ncbi:MAG: DUF1289 domain-containing protein [Fimbriimonadaceae bacterium]|nr:DUF1289 domain-containing protein [Fimbriimonadaceae bacterium]
MFRVQMSLLPSPCVGICVLDAKGVCCGCKRSIEEITAWPSMTEEEKEAVLLRLKKGLDKWEKS